MLIRLNRKPMAVSVRKLSVYLQPFRRSSFLERACAEAEDRKN